MQTLHRDDRQKKLSVLVGQDTVVLLERMAIKEDECKLENFIQEHDNDVYKWGRFNEHTKAVVISPADALHICKYSEAGKARKMILESALDYQEKVQPWIAKQARTEWLDNILQGRAEQDQVYHQDDHVLIIPDYKWTSREDVKELYLLVLFKDPSLRSLRDVKDANLLRKVRLIVNKVLQDKHGLTVDLVSMYFHYPPTYYRLHLHVVSNAMIEFCSSHVGLAHSIDSVIYNLQQTLDYYEKADIPVLIGPQHPLFN